MRLYTKQVTFALAPLFAAAIVALGLAYYISSQDIAHSYNRTAHAEMTQHVELVAHFFEERQVILQTLAAAPVMRSSVPEPILAYLGQEERRLSDYFEGLYLNSLEGDVVGPDGGRFNVRDRPYFAKMARGEITYSDVIESRDTGKRIVLLLAPIFNDAGEHLGALGGAIPIDVVVDDLKRGALDFQGKLVLFDTSGEFLVDGEVPPIVDDAIAQALRNTALDLRRPHTASAGEYFFSVQRAPILGWLLVVYRPRLAVYSSLISASWKVSFVFGLGMLAALALAMGATRWVMMPLNDLRSQLQALGRGQRDVRIRAVRDDELGEIARVFNTMAKRLQDREDQLRSLTETMSEGFAVCELVHGPDGAAVDYRFVDVNPAFKALLGIEHRPLREVTASEVFGANPPPFLGIFAQARETNEPASTMELCPNLTKHLHISVVSPRAGVYTMLVLDITERRRAEEMRLDMERRLLHAQKLESLGVLAGGIAHDFNNLLMAAMGNLELAYDDTPPGSDARLPIESAQAATRRAADLTRQMLAYSGRTQFLVEPINLNALVAENVQMFRTAIPRNVSMSVRCDEAPVYLEGDAGQVQQVVMNLITNAAEAIGDASGEVVISTGTAQCDEGYLNQSHTIAKPPPGLYAYVDVRDSGCGMDSDTLTRLFEPFFTTKFTGRGLGMASVLGVVQGHGGAILVTTAPGQGTAMRVLFPAVPAPEAVEPAHDVALRRDAESSETILIVDDEPMVRDLCARLIRAFGFQPLTAVDGLEAVEIVRDHPGMIACILLDLAMPRKSGPDALRDIRAIEPEVPVIICTGYADDASQAGLAEQRIEGFLHKPYTVDELRQAIHKALAGAAAVDDA